jgi:hypothetical protein
MSGIIVIFVFFAVLIAFIILSPVIVRSMSVKINFYIIGGYLAILLVLSLVVPLLPSGKLIKVTNAPQTNVSNFTTNNVYKQIQKGNFSAPAGYRAKVDTFAVKSGTITITPVNDLLGQVYVATKGIDIPDNGDGKIDVYSYGTAYIGNTNFAPNLDLLTVKYSENNLTIANTEQKSVQFCKFYDGYAVGQFFNANLTMSSGAIINGPVIVLLPSGVKVSGEGYQTFDSLKS